MKNKNNQDSETDKMAEYTQDDRENVHLSGENATTAEEEVTELMNADPREEINHVRGE